MNVPVAYWRVLIVSMARSTPYSELFLTFGDGVGGIVGGRVLTEAVWMEVAVVGGAFADFDECALEVWPAAAPEAV